MPAKSGSPSLSFSSVFSLAVGAKEVDKNNENFATEKQRTQAEK